MNSWGWLACANRAVALLSALLGALLGGNIPESTMNSWAWLSISPGDNRAVVPLSVLLGALLGGNTSESTMNSAGWLTPANSAPVLSGGSISRKRAIRCAINRAIRRAIGEIPHSRTSLYRRGARKTGYSHPLENWHVPCSFPPKELDDVTRQGIHKQANTTGAQLDGRPTAKSKTQ